MFKKTPIALAVLMLTASVSYAQSQGGNAGTSGSQEQIQDTPGMYYFYSNGGTGIFDEDDGYSAIYESPKNKRSLIDLQDKVGNHHSVSTVLFSNFESFKYHARENNVAIVGGPGELAFGLSLVEGQQIGNTYALEDQQVREQVLVDGKPIVDSDDDSGTGYKTVVVNHINPKVLVTAIDSLTIDTDGASAIQSIVQSGQEDSDIYIAAKVTEIATTKADNNSADWAIHLEGSSIDEAIAEDKEQANMVFLKANSDRFVALNKEYTYFWQNYCEGAPNANREYGIAEDQKLTIKAPQNAILLNHRSTIDVHAGHVDIRGNVQINNGSSLMMGYKEAEEMTVPEYLHDYIFDDNGSNEYLISSVKITGKDTTATAEEKAKYGGVIPTLRVENGSHFTAAAKNITISGIKFNNENQFGKKDGSDDIVKYGTAIWFDTKESKYWAEDGDVDEGETKYKLPAILSIYATEKLEINGDIVLNNSDPNAIGLVDIRTADNATLKLNGNIYVTNKEGQSFNLAHLGLKGKDKEFKGQIVDKFEGHHKPGHDHGTHIEIGHGGKMHLTGDSKITKVEAGDSDIHAGESMVEIHNLDHRGHVTFYADTYKKGQLGIGDYRQGHDPKPAMFRMLRAAPMLVEEPAPELSIVLSSVPDDVTAEQLASVVDFSDDSQNPGYSIARYESSEATTWLVTVGAGANPTIESDLEDNTSVAKAINDVAGLGVLAWRAQMNDVNKRLGDLRTYQGNYGGWARVYGNETKYGDLGLKSESNTVQVGADMKIADNFYFGATASYTNGKGKLNNGSTDDRAYSFGVYGGWMGDDGQFVDVIIKEHNFATDFDLRYTTGERSTGDFDLWGTSICAEYGWRLNVTDKLWVEPQAEITYGYINDVTYTYSGDVKATQEATESLVGRLGVAFGTTFDAGSAYVKASVAHDWMGETEISMSNGNAPMKEDLGGTWGEFAVGGTYNFGNGWAVYGEFQTAKGSKMKTPYQYNIGARYVF